MLASCARKAPLFLLLLVIGALFYTGLAPHPGFLRPLVLFLCGIGLAMPFFSEVAALFLLGCSICILPMLKPYALSLFVVCWLAGWNFRRSVGPAANGAPQKKMALIGFLAFYLLLAAAAAHTVSIQTDSLILSAIRRYGGWHDVLRYFLEKARAWKPLYLEFAGYICCAPLLFALSRRENLSRLRYLFAGLAVGVLGSAEIFLAQYFRLGSVFSMTRNAFWVQTERFSAAFSDPNALGIAGALLIPLLFAVGTGRLRILFSLSAAVLLAVAPWSGSRSLWLGLGLWCAAFVYQYLKARLSAGFRSSYLAFVCFMALALAGIGYPPLNGWLQHFSPATGTTRLLQTLSWSEGGQMFYSRMIYSRIALRLWSHQPLIGAGLGQFFPRQAETARELGINLGSWRDNANNFYLQILAESGIAGFIVLLFALHMFGLALAGEPVEQAKPEPFSDIGSARTIALTAKTTLVMLLLLLITGPHLVFEEVRFIATIVLALGLLAVRGRPDIDCSVYEHRLLLLTLLTPIIFLLVLAGETGRDKAKGLYGREYAKDVGSFAWTGDSAVLGVCPGEEALEIELRAAHPDLGTRPVAVQLSYHKAAGKQDERRLVEINTSEWRTVQVSGPQAGKGNLSINVSRLWSPLRAGAGQDWRWLGVMVKVPKFQCRPG